MDVLQALGAAVVIVSIILVQTRKTPLYDARKT
jgi:hypothetical protein